MAEWLRKEKLDQTRLKQSIDIIFQFSNTLSLASSTPLENTRVEINLYFNFLLWWWVVAPVFPKSAKFAKKFDLIIWFISKWRMVRMDYSRSWIVFDSSSEKISWGVCTLRREGVNALNSHGVKICYCKILVSTNFGYKFSKVITWGTLAIRLVRIVKTRHQARIFCKHIYAILVIIAILVYCGSLISEARFSYWVR